MNGLRSRIAVQVDGGVRTGRDVVIGALLGADEFGFATAPLIAAGCIMMRKCHLNTCPVGVATQDPVLRKRFVGQPEHVINYLLLRRRGSARADGGARLSHVRRDGRPAADARQGRARSSRPRRRGSTSRSCSTSPTPWPGDTIYHCDRAGPSARARARPHVSSPRRRTRSSTASTCGSTCRSATPTARPARCCRARSRKRYGHAGLRDDTIHIKLKGTAGQSFGAFLAKGVTLELEGDGNDYVGKGLSGGRIVVYPPQRGDEAHARSSRSSSATRCSTARSPANAISAASPASASRVRNSGAIAVVEGAGDHGCEYMTGGIVVVIGETGRNFAAGMSGGIAYVLDEAGDFAAALQPGDGRARAGRGRGRGDAAPSPLGRRSAERTAAST